MMEQDFGVELWDEKKELARVLCLNEKTKSYGLSLSEADARVLFADRKNILMEKRRVEFGAGILPQIIDTFYDSPYLYQDNYVETLGRLMDIFYEYKNESMDTLTDEELLSFMEEAFNGECQGSADYLEETILEKMARAIRVGGQRFLREQRRRRAVEDEV